MEIKPNRTLDGAASIHNKTRILGSNALNRLMLGVIAIETSALAAATELHLRKEHILDTTGAIAIDTGQTVLFAVGAYLIYNATQDIKEIRKPNAEFVGPTESASVTLTDDNPMSMTILQEGIDFYVTYPEQPEPQLHKE